MTRVGLTDGIEVGVYKLDEIFARVRALDIEGENVLRRELLRRVKRHNWVPEEKTDEFVEVILLAYKNFCKKADSR